MNDHEAEMYVLLGLEPYKPVQWIMDGAEQAAIALKKQGRNAKLYHAFTNDLDIADYGYDAGEVR